MKAAILQEKTHQNLNPRKCQHWAVITLKEARKNYRNAVVFVRGMVAVDIVLVFYIEMIRSLDEANLFDYYINHKDIWLSIIFGFLGIFIAISLVTHTQKQLKIASKLDQDGLIVEGLIVDKWAEWIGEGESHFIATIALITWVICGWVKNKN